MRLPNPYLGVCLGHQAIGEVFGGKLMNLTKVYHGVASPCKLFHRIPEYLCQCRSVQRCFGWISGGTLSQLGYRPEWFSGFLEVTATDSNGQIMALRHKNYDILGVQFHPESVLTPGGEQIMRNWLERPKA